MKARGPVSRPCSYTARRPACRARRLLLVRGGGEQHRLDQGQAADRIGRGDRNAQRHRGAHAVTDQIQRAVDDTGRDARDRGVEIRPVRGPAAPVAAASVAGHVESAQIHPRRQPFWRSAPTARAGQHAMQRKGRAVGIALPVVLIDAAHNVARCRSRKVQPVLTPRTADRVSRTT